MQSIVVDNEGTKLSYIDSGVPITFRQNYITVFAVHGSLFSSRKHSIVKV